MNYKEIQNAVDNFKKSADLGIRIRNVNRYEENKKVNKIIRSVFKRNNKEETEDKIVEGVSLYKKFNRILGMYLEYIGYDITDKKIKENDFNRLMKLPLFILEIGKTQNQRQTSDVIEYFNGNLYKINDGYIERFKRKINTEGLIIDDIIDLGKYLVSNFKILSSDKQFEFYYRNFNVFVRDYITIDDNLFLQNYENIKAFLKENNIILKDLEPIYNLN